MDNSFDEFKNVIVHEIEHQVAHAVGSPAIVNRTIGEAMRHIGSLLTLGSAPYLPINPEEILAQPQRLPNGSKTGVVLVKRTINSENAFRVLAGITKKEDGTRTIQLIAHKPDEFDLSKTKFIPLPAEVGNEIVRQLNELVDSGGHVLLQCVVINEYFNDDVIQQIAPEKTEEDDSLFSSDVNAPAEEPPAPEDKHEVTQGSLPPVNMGSLL